MAFWDMLRSAAARPAMAAAPQGAPPMGAANIAGMFAAPNGMLGAGLGGTKGMTPEDWQRAMSMQGDPTQKVPMGMGQPPPGIVPQPWEMTPDGRPPTMQGAPLGLPQTIQGRYGSLTQMPRLPGLLGRTMTPEQLQQAMFGPRPATSPSGSGSAYGPMGSAVKTLGGGKKF